MPSARSNSETGPGPARGTGDSSADFEVLRWTQRAPRFAPLREGGPGRPGLLILLGLVLVVLLRGGLVRMDGQGIDGAGPAMVLLALLGLGTLALWLLVKAVLRPLEADAVVDARGVRLVPSAGQRRLDRWMRALTHLAFLISWKGGQWGSYAPELRWQELRELRHWPERGAYLLRGGAWDIRLTPPAALRARLQARLQARLEAVQAKRGDRAGPRRS